MIPSLNKSVYNKIQTFIKNVIIHHGLQKEGGQVNMSPGSSKKADSTKGYRRMDESISPQGIPEMASLGRGFIPSATKEETS